MRSEDHPPVPSMSMMGTPASLAAEEEAARVLLLCSEQKRLKVHFKYSFIEYKAAIVHPGMLHYATIKRE